MPVLFANPRRRKRSRAKARAASSHPRRSRRRSRRLARIRGPVFIKRRSNPGRRGMGRISSLIRIGVAGGLGVVTARVGMFLYTKHLSATVVGGDTDPNSIRNILNEALRLVAGAALTLVVERAVLARVGKPGDRVAFKIGGLAEVGRQGVGLLVKRIAPTANLEQYGLNGYGGMANRYAMGELEEASSFEGLEDVSSFQGIEEADDFAYDDSPYQVAVG